MPVKTIVAALALAADSEAVARRAVQLAREQGARLVLLHVIEGRMLYDPTLPTAADAAAMRSLLVADARERLGHLTAGAPPATEVFVESGPPHEHILRYAERHAADLLVIGPGEARNIREKVFGSTADRVVRASSCPVLVVKASPGPALAHPYEGVVVGVDHSDLSKAAAGSAARIAPSADFELLHAVEIPLAFEQAMLKVGTSRAEIERYRSSKSQAARAQLLAEFSAEGRLPPRTTIRVVQGDPAQALIRSSRRRKTELIALGTHGLNAVARHLLGSVARKVLMAAGCDVLVVPPSAQRNQP